MACDTTKGIMQIDHIRPKHVYRSGWYDPKNLQVLCRKCNMKKGMTTKDHRLEWAKRNPDNEFAKRFLKKHKEGRI